MAMRVGRLNGNTNYAFSQIPIVAWHPIYGVMGGSDAPPTGYTMANLLQDLEALITHLEIQPPFILVGHSFGAAIASEYALRRPERIEKLVLISASISYSLGKLADLALLLPTPIVAAVLKVRRMIHRSALTQTYVLKGLYRETISRWRGAGLLDYLKVPALVITGHRDLLFPQKHIEEVAQRIPGAQRVIVPVSAHMVMVERPEAVNRAIQRLIEPGREAAVAGIPADFSRPGHRHYSPEVPPQVRIPEQPLYRFLELSAQRHPKQTALVYGGRRPTIKDSMS